MTCLEYRRRCPRVPARGGVMPTLCGVCHCPIGAECPVSNIKPAEEIQ